MSARQRSSGASETAPGVGEPRACPGCGRPLPSTTRRTALRCRLCAAQRAQAYLLRALSPEGRRQRRQPR